MHGALLLRGWPPLDGRAAKTTTDSNRTTKYKVTTRAERAASGVARKRFEQRLTTLRN